MQQNNDNPVTTNENMIETLPEDVQNSFAEIPEEFKNIINSLPEDTQNSIKSLPQNMDITDTILKAYTSSPAIQETGETMAKVMTEAVMKKTVLTKVGELTANLTNSFASSFNVDQDKIASSFKMKMTEDEITRIITAMLQMQKLI